MHQKRRKTPNKDLDRNYDTQVNGNKVVQENSAEKSDMAGTLNNSLHVASAEKDHIAVSQELFPYP